MTRAVDTAPAPARPSLDPGSFDAPTSAALAALMQRGWGKSPQPSAPPAPPVANAERRRARLRAAFAENALVVPAGQLARRGGDQFYPFRADSDYVWLTGDQTAGGVLAMVPGADPVLYLQPPSDRESGEFWRNATTGELWVGPRASLDTRSAELGLECRPLAELPAVLAGLPDGRVLPGANRSDGPAIDRSGRDDYGDRELRAVLSELRLVKDDWEIQQLASAVDSTARGFTDVARLLRAGGARTERDLECAFDARARTEGLGVGYHTISAIGGNATTLHWNRNDGPVVPGQLLLMDAGVETNSLYTADVTRTLPVSGRFTALQRRVYEIVLAAQDAALLMVRPGQPFRAFYAESARVLAEGLADLGVLPVSAAESLAPDSGLHRRWTLCSPGHMLGLDVHDCGSARAPEYLDGILEQGHVLTVEPGLYFQANDELVPAELRGLGFRIEDDLVVTADGYDLLSASLPRAVDDIEAWLAAPDELR